MLPKLIKLFFFFTLFLASSCRSSYSGQNNSVQQSPITCCQLHESKEINVSELAKDFVVGKNLMDIFLFEIKSGLPSPTLSIHLFAVDSTHCFIERSLENGRVEKNAVDKIEIFMEAKKLSNSHYYDLCSDYSTSPSLNVFDFRCNGKSKFSYSLSITDYNMLCEDEKNKIRTAHALSEKMIKISNGLFDKN